MDLKGFIVQALMQKHEGSMEMISDLTPEELAWRPGPEANHFGWMLWHAFRVEDTRERGVRSPAWNVMQGSPACPLRRNGEYSSGFNFEC